jgi:hypothetical protein
MIPNNEREDRTDDFEFLYSMGADLTEIPYMHFSSQYLRGNDNLYYVTIPNRIKIIGDSAFFDNLLKEVTIPDSVTTIGSWAFRENKLKQVTIPDSVTTIGDGAFSENLLERVKVPKSVKLGEYVFQDNPKPGFALVLDI